MTSSREDIDIVIEEEDENDKEEELQFTNQQDNQEDDAYGEDGRRVRSATTTPLPPFSPLRPTDSENASAVGVTTTAQRKRIYAKKLKRKGRPNLPRAATLPNLGSRMPYHYNPGEVGSRDALISRYRYYARLDPRSGSVLQIPDHVIPFTFFSILPFEEGKKQHSIVTIFSIWNTMVGTALLSMPWALGQTWADFGPTDDILRNPPPFSRIKVALRALILLWEAGFLLGIFIMLSMAGLAFYTAYRVVESPNGINLNMSMSPEFSDVCRYFWGKWGEWLGVGFSLVVLLGSTIVYWVLMSNFLFHTGQVIYDSVQPNTTEIIIMKNDTFTCDVFCEAKKPSLFAAEEQSLFEKMWKLDLTVPFYLVLLAFPLLNFESPTFFTKFNGLGTVSVVYLLVFVSIKASECGFHLDITLSSESLLHIPLASVSFPALTGTLGLSYFIHNCILTILRNQKVPQNNVRDLSVAYVLVACTYMFIAVMFYSSFPLAKNCIADNFLNNFNSADLLSAIARLFLLFQMLTVFPLLTYLIRAQLSWAVKGNVYPGLKWVLLLNSGVVVLCIFFAVFFPSVGAILRFVGSFSGLAYMFAMPSLIHLERLRMFGGRTTVQIVVHIVIVGLGVANLIGQFVIL